METPVQAIVKAQVTAATPPTAPLQVTAATPPSAPAQVTAATPTIAPAQAAGAALPVVPTQDDAAASPDGLDFQESDVANPSHSPGRLVISDDTDLTPGQREPSARSELSPSTQRESSKFSSSDEGEDRGDAKRTFPSTSSGSDGPIASTVKKKRSEPHDSDEDYSLTF
ncbi:arabinogalactan protein 1-like [Ixodes scapularis]|uniref:arabinogalactan protein 1-like n=1 Tax=Ixodes scapularis TaxID=6945 RepID=UPI001A9E73A8|nr:arabinogalactan protein 1-like [Ixodes scapularis]